VSFDSQSVIHKWNRAEKQVPFDFAQGRLSTPAATAPKAGAKNQVVAFAQDDGIYETSSSLRSQIARALSNEANSVDFSAFGNLF
jgi:hypothetical protein